MSPLRRLLERLDKRIAELDMLCGQGKLSGWDDYNKKTGARAELNNWVRDNVKKAIKEEVEGMDE